MKAVLFSYKALIIDIEADFTFLTALELGFARYALEISLQCHIRIFDTLFHDIASYFFQPGMRCLFQYIVDIFANFALCYTLALLVCLFIGIEEIVVRPAGSPGTFPEKNFLLLSWQKPYLYCSLHFSLPRQ